MVWLRGFLNHTVRSNFLIKTTSRDFRSSSVSNETLTLEQKKLILTRLNASNALPEGRLPRKLAQAIRDRLDSAGPFENLEQLLELPGVGPKSIRTVCEKILSNEDHVGTAATASSTKKRKSAFSVPTFQINKNLNCLVSIFVDIGTVSWAKLNFQNKSVVDWDLRTYETGSSDLRPLLQEAVSLEKLLPDGDVYVLEEHNNTPYSKGSSRTLCLTCMLSTVLHLKRDGNDTDRIVFLKSRLVDRHFNAIVGSESVALQPIVEDMIQGRFDNEPKSTANRYSHYHIGPPLAAYMKKKAPYEKELLSRAALIGVCLADLSLSNR